MPAAVQEVLIKPQVSLETATAVRGVGAAPHEKGNLGQRSQRGGALRARTWLPQLFRFA